MNAHGLLLAAVLAGCGPSNAPPKFLSFNGLEARKIPFDEVYGLNQSIRIEPGTPFDMSVEVEDPEGREVEIWVPYAPPGFDFPPDGTTGSWDATTDELEDGWSSLDFIARDTATNAAASVLTVEFEL